MGDLTFGQQGNLRQAMWYFNVLNSLVAQYRRGGQEMVTALVRFEQEKANVYSGMEHAIELAYLSVDARQLSLDYVTTGYKLMSIRSVPSRRIPYQLDALRIAEHFGERLGQCHILLNLSGDYAMSGDFVQAKSRAESVIRIAEILGDERLVRMARIQLNMFEINLGKTPVDWDNQLISSAASVDPKDIEIDGIEYIQSGNAALLRNDFKVALTHFERGLALIDPTNNLSLKWAFLNSIALVNLQMGKLKRAMDFAEQALEITTQLDDRFAKATCLGQIANIYLAQKQYKKAIEYYHQTIGISEAQSDKAGLANRYFNLGQAYTAVGITQQALDFLEKARLLYLEISKQEWLKRIDELIAYNKNPLTLDKRTVARLLHINISS